MLLFTKIILTSAKLRKSWYQKIYFLKFHICVYLCVKLKVSNIILTSSREDPCIFTPSPPPPQNERLKSPLSLGLRYIYMGVQLQNIALFLISIARRKKLIQELHMKKSTVSPSLTE